ncbi:MAG: BMP family ABC transporter substrate-binding protein [Sciscionella sp.]|nr:BMP family ABC transporter substrate-binding protein [Sciscionella sp.]
MAGVATALALGLALSACGSKPSASASGGSSTLPRANTSFTACMVTDTGGINDKSFNASAWAGMQKSQKDGKANVSFLQSTAENDYAPNIAQLVQQKCKLIITVGGLMGTATADAAKSNPSQHFAIVDSNGNGGNVHGMQFNTAQSGFLGGYLAAGYSKSGKVATFGGQKIPPVTIYMDGFVEGVKYYNAQKHKNVAVLGWDESKQNGSFTGSFTDSSKGQTIANNFIQQGADVIYPVAGGSGLGGAAAAQSSGGKAVVIWVDTDGCVSASQYCNVFLSTTFKDVGGAVTKAVEGAAGGSYATTDYIGTLQNGGTGLSPFHQFDSKVPAGLKSELDQVKADIISGKIKINSPSQPKSS